jgi:hypothetical protein
MVAGVANVSSDATLTFNMGSSDLAMQHDSELGGAGVLADSAFIPDRLKRIGMATSRAILITGFRGCFIRTIGAA